MAEITKQYLALPKFCYLTGLSASTVRRRVRDGSISSLQPGGRKTKLLFAIDAIAGGCHADSTATNPSKPEGIPVDKAESFLPATPPTNSELHGRGPKWKRELAALQICTPRTEDE